MDARLDLEAPAAELRARLEQLEAQHVVERVRARDTFQPAIPYARAHYQFARAMATFDQLSRRAAGDHRARPPARARPTTSSPTCSSLPESRVRELARDALVELAPVSGRGVEEDWRGQLADYVLGQQSGPEATATKRPPEALRGRARLGALAARLARAVLRGRLGAGDPRGRARPRGEARRPPPPAAEREAAAATLGRWPPRATAVMRRRLLAGAGALAAHPARGARLAGRRADGRRRRRRRHQRGQRQRPASRRPTETQAGETPVDTQVAARRSSPSRTASR